RTRSHQRSRRSPTTSSNSFDRIRCASASSYTSCVFRAVPSRPAIGYYGRDARSDHLSFVTLATVRELGGIVIPRKGLPDAGDTGMGATLDRSARDPQELRRLLGRALAEIRELKYGTLTLWEVRHRFGGSLEEIPPLRVPLGARLVRHCGDLRLGGHLARFDRPMAEEIDREASRAKQDPPVE